jgi:two-component system cell cycle sensor histidine kinase/response regulator CckA
MRRLAAGIAHDLGNLLVVLSGACERALSRASAGADPRSELARVERSAQRARELARELLAVGCRQALRPETVDLDRMLAESQEPLRRIVGEQIELTIVAGKGPSAFVDRQQLWHLLVKLLEGVRQRMPEGGSCVITTGADVFWERGRANGENPGRPPCAQLTVRDSGGSLPPAALARVFEPYYSPTEGPGPGLALAVVEGIAVQSGGRVRARSEGVGASFEVLLPAAACGPAREPEAG